MPHSSFDIIPCRRSRSHCHRGGLKIHPSFKRRYNPSRAIGVSWVPCPIISLPSITQIVSALRIVGRRIHFVSSEIGSE